MKSRPVRTVFVTPRFRRSLEHLTPEEKILAEIREQMFRKNAFDARLKTHKLKGKLKKFWSFSITYSHRIIFEFLSKDSVLFYDVGAHDVYK